MTRLQGKVAVVTGAARGLGAAIATRLCEEGAAVMLTDILDGEETSQRLRDAGHQAAFTVMDVAKRDAWKPVLSDTASRFGGIDILVNNAGVYRPATIETIDLDDLIDVYGINLFGPMLGMQAVIPYMRERGGGSIINIASNATDFIFPETISYGSSKAALANMTKAVAVHCGRQGYRIRANSIHPGPHATAMMGTDSPLVQRIPLGRMGTPEELAATVVYLASDDAAFVTATELFVDGGLIAA
ncbi:MAG: SDR family oxidoreductase [Sphingomonadales bacterium]|nr:MAG: SDR family oxidoreductase [Sphingomonadales bacterium]